MSESGALAAAREVVGETTAVVIEPTSNEGLETGVEQQTVAEAAVGIAHPTSSVEEMSQDRPDAYPPREREEAVERIRSSTLPPALRERLAAVVEAGSSPGLDVVACLEAIEETLPEFLRGERRNVARPSHPIGEAFFHGTEELTDAEAETLATKQLERSGLLRGQRARTAD